ncbi:uncharacterized protein [Rutidosis leptorrhynchoides]|uniref:uncharacterized protein isoform X2 n=1 Tax=Rutidosis leptorrhynchoides TaxID=125765 RepID=UPI003A99BDFC
MKALNIRGYYKNMKGVKRLKNINLGTKQKCMKVRAKKKKMNVVDKPVSDNLVDEAVLDKNNNKSPNVNNVPLKEEDQKSWLEFKKLAKGTPFVSNIYDKATFTRDLTRPLTVDHPFVSVIHDFAISAYNEVVHMYGKYGKSGSMSDSEVMSCKYEKRGRHYYFYLTIEAIERGNLAVYEMLVGCLHIDGSGSTSFVRKSLTLTTPTGKIATMLPRLKRLISKYKNVKGEKKDMEIKLERAHKFMKKGQCDRLYRAIESVIPKGWSKMGGIVSIGYHKYRADTCLTGLIQNGLGSSIPRTFLG